MITFVFDYIKELDERWQEVDTLIKQAETCIQTDEKLYNALCRSISILIVSHMEGFIKEITRNVIRDVNSNLEFSQMPLCMKRTFCCKYLGFQNSDSSKIDLMITDLSQYKDFKITHEPFLFFENKNPKPSIIKDVLSKFGVTDIFRNLHGSYFDNTFESSHKASKNLRWLMTIMNSVTTVFPYNASLKRFKLVKSNYKKRTLWQEFLDNLNLNRHKIVHGNTFENMDSIDDIKLNRDKVKILQLLVIYVLCATVSSGIVDKDELNI